MNAKRELLRMITSAQIMSAAVYPTKPYTGPLPKKTVKKGSKGPDVKAVQKFLNWCIKAGLAVDGKCGKKTVSAIKKFQKQYKLKVNGAFGPKSREKAEAIIKKYAPKPAPKPAVKTWVDKANAWCKEMAADDSYHYVRYSSDKRTHECPICHSHPKGKTHGGNCIWAAFAVWHHGVGLHSRCACDVFSNAMYEKMLLKLSAAEALAMARTRTKLKDIKVIRNKNGIPKSEWKAGDICIKFSGSTYVHTFYYMGNGKIFDSRSSGTTAKQIAVRSWDGYSCKMIIRYTGK